MADDIEVGDLVARISFDDTGLNSSMAEINRSMQLVRAQFDSASSALGAYFSEEERLTALSTNLNQQLQLQQQRVNLLNQAFQESVREKGADAAETQRLAVQLARAQTEYNQLNQRLATTTRDLHEQRQVAGQLEDVWKRVQQVLDGAGDSFKKAGDKIKNVGSSMTTGLTAALAAAGAAAGMAASEFDGSAKQIQASLGLTADESEALNDTVKAVWKDSFGADIDQANDAVVRIKQQIQGLDNGEIGQLAGNALTLNKVFSADVNDSVAAAGVLMKNFGIDGTKAMDLITVGFQKGGDFSGELLDTMREYAPQFAGMGKSADDMLAILISGAQTGAFNLDKVGDAVKEFNIRAQDGSKTTAAGFSAIGLKSEEMGAAIAAGGDKADMAFQATLAALASMKDPMKQNQAGVALFGTQWEDLRSQVVLGMSASASSLGQIDGAAQRAGSAIKEGIGAQASKAWKSFQLSLEPIGKILVDVAEQWLPKVSAAIEKASTWFSNLSPQMQNFTLIAAAIGAAIGPVLIVLGTLATVIGALLSPIGLVVAAIVGAVALAAVVIANWDPISKFFTKLWADVTTAFVSAWEGIKNFFNGLWTWVKEFFGKWGVEILAVVAPFIGLPLLVVKHWDDIKAGLGVVWNWIKSTAISAFNAVVKHLSNSFEGLKNTAVNIWEVIKTAIGDAIDWIKGLPASMLEFGKNIMQGLIDGIKSMASKVSNKVKEVADSIKDGISNALGIHSPSRVTTELGYFAAKGLANGLADGEKDVSKAAEKVAKASYDATKDWIDNRKYYNQISLDEELAVWNKAATRYKAGSEQRKAVDREIYRVKQELLKKEEADNKQSFDSSKKWVETRKEFNQISLMDELAAWERVQARYKVGTQEHQDAEKNIINVRKEIYTQLTAASEEFLSKTKEINANVEAEEKRLNDVYAQTVDERAKSIYSFAGLFDEVSKKADISSEKLLQNLQDQVGYLETWAVNLHNLAERGIDKGLLEELRLMGPGAYAEISALNSMTDSELYTFQSLWKEKTELARYAALDQMTGMRTDTDAQIAQMKKDAAAQLVGLKKVFEDKVREIRSGVAGEFNIMTAELPDIGKQAMKGLINGMDGMKGEVMSKAREIANAVSKTIQKALDIHSPSRVTMELGEFTGLGLAEGLENSLKIIQRQAAAMADFAVPVMKGLQAPDTKGVSAAAAPVSTVTNQYTFAPGSVVIPAADIAQMKTINDFFARFQQTARAMGVNK